MTVEEMSKLSGIVNKEMRSYIEELVMREVDGRVHQMKMDILNDIGEAEIRAMVKEAVRSRVDVEVRMK